jgi:hypothetical protein
VPYGFICGFPTKGGDLYGGSMYMPSAQDEGALQARATSAAILRWGEGGVIGHPVCKGKYQPWKEGKRQYGCFRHHLVREERIRKAGLREGWEPFDQWPYPWACDDEAKGAEAEAVACTFGSSKQKTANTQKQGNMKKRKER